MSSVNRIPYLLTKRVDVLIASLGITPERAKQVAFTIPYAATQSMVLPPAATKIKTLDDLKGLNVAVARGTSNDIFISKKAPPGVNLRRFEGESAAAQALITGQNDALVTTNTMVPSILAAAPRGKLMIQQQENAMAVQRDATDLRLWLTEFLYYIKGDGELDAIHQKWLKEPLPELHTF